MSVSSPSLRVLSPLVLGLGIFVAPFASGCSTSAEDSESDQGAVTDLPQTAVRDQWRTGNCWLFTTTAWIESQELQARRMREPSAQPAKPISVAHLDYFDWLEKITTDYVKTRTAAEIREELDDGGSWGLGVELVKKYGIIAADDFARDGAQHDATVAWDASMAVAKELATGVLKTREARHDRALVRSVLDRAFRLKRPVVEAMTATYGEDLSRTFERRSTTSRGKFRGPDEVRVLVPRTDGPAVERSLVESIGERAATPPGLQQGDFRSGQFAWSTLPFPKDMNEAQSRAFLRRVQRALVAGGTVPFSWYAANPRELAESGAVHGRSKPADSDMSGYHASLMVDFEVKLANGVVLRAGQALTDEQKASALADDAKVVFFRIKNSWGTKLADKSDAVPDGYNDLYVDYLTAKLRACPEGDPASSECTDVIPLDDVTLPIGF